MPTAMAPLEIRAISLALTAAGGMSRWFGSIGVFRVEQPDRREHQDLEIEP
jgi:hypothetical protein